MLWLGQITNVVRGIVFLGTPQKKRLELLQGCLDSEAMATRTRDFKSPNWNEELADYPFIDGLNLQTWDIVVNDIQVRSFHETELKDAVVPYDLATVGHWREKVEGLHTKHGQMSKFGDFNDPNYRKVAAALRDLYHSVSPETIEGAPPRPGNLLLLPALRDIELLTNPMEYQEIQGRRPNEVRSKIALCGY
jgi:hypothetical protein